MGREICSYRVKKAIYFKKKLSYKEASIENKENNWKLVNEFVRFSAQARRKFCVLAISKLISKNI